MSDPIMIKQVTKTLNDINLTEALSKAIHGVLDESLSTHEHELPFNSFNDELVYKLLEYTARNPEYNVSLAQGIVENIAKSIAGNLPHVTPTLTVV